MAWTVQPMVHTEQHPDTCPTVHRPKTTQYPTQHNKRADKDYAFRYHFYSLLKQQTDTYTHITKDIHNHNSKHIKTGIHITKNTHITTERHVSQQ